MRRTVEEGLVLIKLLFCLNCYFVDIQFHITYHETWPELAFTVSSFSLEIEKEEVEVNTCSSLAVFSFAPEAFLFLWF